MRDKFIFENHLGKRFDGLANGVYMNYNDLRDYSWNFDTINNRISRFYHTTTSRKIPLVVCCDTVEKALTVKNQLLEMAEVDIEAMIPGKIYIGDYYTTGYITASVKSDYLITKRHCKIELTLTQDDPMWYREKTYVFLPGSASGITVSDGMDYPYDYSYDYGVSQVGHQITCDGIRDSAFKLRIYGEITNPTVIIGGKVYSVTGAIATKENVLIDSLTKTITLHGVTGEQVNWFDKRDRENYIFTPIPPGLNTIIWDNTFGFDLTVIEKRSEPKWT